MVKLKKYEKIIIAETLVEAKKQARKWNKGLVRTSKFYVVVSSGKLYKKDVGGGYNEYIFKTSTSEWELLK